MKRLFFLLISLIFSTFFFSYIYAYTVSDAELLMKKNDYGNAKKILLNILSEKPAKEIKIKAWFLLSECVTSPTDANYYLKKIISISPDKYSSEANLRMGKNLFAKKKFKKANACFEKIINDPHSEYFEEALFCSAESYYHLKKFSKAIIRYRNFFEFGKKESTLELSQIMIGNSYFKLENYSSAIAAYQKALESAKGTNTAPFILYHISQSYEKISQYKKAMNSYKKIINDYPYSQEKPLAENRVVYLTEHGYHDSSLKMPDITMKLEDSYVVQLAAFLKRSQAEISINNFQHKGYETKIYEKIINGKQYFCVVLKPFHTFDEAKYQKLKLKKAGIDSFIFKSK
ncbi:MAG: tetratricopeptide repeat protein [Candidatus Cloacimonadota bacterium]|nr:tetratricopeptide repeat protein [Candidatus Cloacimonadota bacterium]